MDMLSAHSLQFLQEPKSLSCLGHNSVNMIIPLQRRINHNAQSITFSILSGSIP